ncbi:MAG: EamA family transporter [Verrucomicrobia bacterium]|nr:EamA family transporter [Verrucomicrobiota bacterium]
MVWLLVVSLIWGLSFGLIKVSFGGVPPGFLTAARLALALLVFLPFLRWRGLGSKTVARLMLLGALQYGMMYYLLFNGFRYLQAHEAALYTITTPLFIAAWYSWRHRYWHSRLALAAAVAVIGAAVIQFQPDKAFSGWTGFWLLQGSNLCFAIGQLYYRELRNSISQALTDAQLFTWIYVGATVMGVGFTTWEGSWNTWQSLSQTQWLALLYLGTVASGLAFFLWNYGAARTAPGPLAVMNNVKIPMAIALAVTLFGEQAHWERFIPGCLLLGVALWLGNRHNRTC